MASLFKRLYNLAQYIFLSPAKFARKQGVQIGHSCSIQTKYFGSEPYLISIGDNVQITSGVKFFTHGGGWILRTESPNFDAFGKISIGSNVYVGNNVLIMPGVEIGNNVIIGAGAVVTKSVPSDSVIAGNPAKMISSCREYIEKQKEYNVGTGYMLPREKRDALLSLSNDKFIKKKSM